ncbi:MAG: hypothetical protein AAF846_28980 [Chloroflexota bacterium]
MTQDMWMLLLEQTSIIILLVIGVLFLIWLMISMINYYRDLSFKLLIALLESLGMENASEIFGDPKKMRFPVPTISVSSDADLADRT